jgi:hypothetical protein
MTKTILMLLGLAAVFAAGTACFGIFTRSDSSEASLVEACAGLSGQAKVDCEHRQER